MKKRERHFWWREDAAAILASTDDAELFRARRLLKASALIHDVPGCLPNDPQALANAARLTPARWRKLAPALLRDFDEAADGLLEHRELREHLTTHGRFVEAGREGARRRWGQQSDDSPPTTNPIHPPNGRANSPPTSKANSPPNASTAEYSTEQQQPSRPGGGGGAVPARAREAPISRRRRRALGERLVSDVDRQALEALLARVPEPGLWTAEMQASLDGMAGHWHVTPEQLGRAVREYVGNGVERPGLGHFRGYLKRVRMEKPEPELTVDEQQAKLREWAAKGD